MSQEQNINDNEVVENISHEVTTMKESKVKDKKQNKKILKKIKLQTVIPCILVGALGLGIGFNIGQDNGRKLPATYKSYSNKVIATVGDTKITEKELKYRMEPLFYINSKEELTDEEIEAYEATFIDYMTTLEVLYLEGKSEGISVTEEDIDTEYETLLSSLSSTYQQSEEVLLNKLKIPKEIIQKDLEKELIATQYIAKETEVSDTEAKNYYDKNKDEFFTVQASHILIQTSDDEGNELSDEKKKEKKTQAQSILDKAKKGVDFATLAKEYSEDSSSINGGDLGFFAKGQMVQEFEDAAFNLKVGEITDELVETDYGYHIIKKTDEEYQEFEDVKENIKDSLSYEKQSNTLDNLILKYDVTVK